MTFGGWWDGLGDLILTGLVHPGGLLSYLREHGILADQLRELAEEARTTERSRGQISSPDGGDAGGDIAPCSRYQYSRTKQRKLNSH